MKKCREFCDQFSDYMEGELSESECKLIEEHLAACSPCALEYKSLKSAVEVCSKGISDDMPEEVRDRLKAFLKQRCKNLHP
ncbi:MAG: zf-HC2 domain-containing protein [Desulfomonile tiedjei]|nr:zf-HC2 domain-containing protein [Desulfomonile tiedjei]